MTEPQTIPWKRISVEAIAIVASILLAFAIDAWWDEVQEREFERETLTALLEEFQDHRVELDLTLQGHVSMLVAIDGLISYAVTDDRSLERYPIDEYMFWLTIPATTDFGSGVRDSIVSSGQLEIISDKVLRYEIAEWSSVLDELKDNQEHNVNLILEHIIPYVTREGVPYPAVEIIDQELHIPSGQRLLSADPDTTHRIFSDPEFLSILDFRRGFLSHTISEIEELIAATDSINERIELAIIE